MRKTIAFIYILACTAGCASIPRQNGMPDDWSESNLNGRIKQIVEINRDLLDYNSPESSGAYDSSTEIRYNHAGYMTLMEVRKGPAGQQVTRDEYEYDPTGKIITKSVSFKANEKTYKEYFYEYDRKGRILKESDTHQNYFIYYKYNRRNKVKKVKAVYDHPDNKDKPTTLITAYRYGPKGSLMSVREGGSDRTYHYDDNGKLHEITRSDGQREVFDKHGNMVELIQPVIIEPQGDEPGYVLETSIKAEYEYDPAGNWIKRTQYYEGRPINETTRRIEYY